MFMSRASHKNLIFRLWYHRVSSIVIYVLSFIFIWLGFIGSIDFMILGWVLMILATAHAVNDELISLRLEIREGD